MAPNGPHVSSPSIAREFRENKQEVCFSDDAAWMPHRNDRNYLRSAGYRNELGVFSFAYCSLDKQRKVRPAAGKQKSNLAIYLKRILPSGRLLFRLLASLLFFASPKKSSQKKGDPNRSCFLRVSGNCCRSDATSMSRSHSNALPVRLTPFFLQCSGNSYGRKSGTTSNKS